MTFPPDGDILITMEEINKNITLKKESPPRCNNCHKEDDPQRTLVKTHSKFLIWEKKICPKYKCSVTTADIMPGVTEEVALIELEEMVG